MWGCWLVALLVMGCATTRYEEFGEPPTAEMAQQFAADSVPVLEAQIQELLKFVHEIRQKYLIYPRKSNFSPLDTKVLFIYTLLITVLNLSV